jgi:hypothetical protein
MKEAFSAQLLPRLLKDADFIPKSDLRLFDPFLGVGTSLLSGIEHAQQSSSRFYGEGIERNPLLWHIASTKLRASIAKPGLCERVYQASREIIGEACNTPMASDDRVPGSVTLNNAKYFPRENVAELLSLRAFIERLSPCELAETYCCFVSQHRWSHLESYGAMAEPCDMKQRASHVDRFQPSTTKSQSLSKIYRGSVEYRQLSMLISAMLI